MPRTTDAENFCMVYYPDRPKQGGFTVQKVELRSDIIRKLERCGAFKPAPTPTDTKKEKYTDADYLGYYGSQDYKKKDYKSAEDLFKQALALEPNNESVNRSIAMLYEDQERWPEVIPARKRLAAVKPDDAANWFHLGNAQRHVKLFSDAVESFARTIRLEPDAQNWYFLGLTYNDLKQYDKAILAYHEALKLDDKHALANYNLGLALYGAKRYGDAVDAFQRSISLKVDGPEYVYSWIGDSYAMLKMWDAALAASKEAVRLKPDYDYAVNLLGTSQFWLKRYTDALTSFQTAIRLKPNTALYQQNLGNTYVALGRKTEALALQQKLKTLDAEKAQELLDNIDSNGHAQTQTNSGSVKGAAAQPNKPPAKGTPAHKPGTVASRPKETPASKDVAPLVAQAKRSWDAKDYANAIETSKKAIALDPNSVDAWGYLAMSYHDSEKWQLAADAFPKYVALAKPESSPYRLWADCYLELKQFDKAAALFEKALPLAVDDDEKFDTLFKLGDAYFDAENYAKALEPMRQASLHDPKDADALFELGICYTETGKKAEAQEILKRLEPINLSAAHTLQMAIAMMGIKR